MNPTRVIERKRDGKELSPQEIKSFISGLADGSATDYHASAFLMAVFFQGMTLDETVALTQAMLESGNHYNLSDISGAKVDKHSTGGVGDKVSLILAPLAAACGLRVPMMSGRGLGHSGGTLDKLESISGFNVYLNEIEFRKVLSKLGCAMIGQSKTMTPADRKLYSLRDVTGTVECVPLIVASILSKKLAEGCDALVLDVKVGSGAFMKTLQSAKTLAKTLISVAKKMKLPCRAILTNMHQPLGYAVGNSLEVFESIQILRNGTYTPNAPLDDLIPPRVCSSDLRELTIQLCAHMLVLGKKVKNLQEGRKLADQKLRSGDAWKIFQDLVQIQNGDVTQVLHPEKLQMSSEKRVVASPQAGFITKMNTEVIGQTVVEMGGGRKKASDTIDPSVGLVFHKKLGAKVKAGDPIVTAYLPKDWKNHPLLPNIDQELLRAISISKSRKAIPKLVFGSLS